MTNIAICDQHSGHKGRMVDGSRVAIRARDEDGLRTMEIYDCPAQVFVDIHNFNRKGEWADGSYQRFKTPQPYGSAADVLEYFREAKFVKEVEANASKTIDGDTLTRITLKSRSDINYLQRNFTPIYGADLDQADLCLIQNDIQLKDFEIR